MSPADESARPLPQAARAQWRNALARAGWPEQADHARPARPQARPGTERITVDTALGRITAAPVTARWPSPRAACAAMDGIAVQAAALAAAPAVDPGDRAVAGQSGGGTVRLPAGQFSWIDTGDPIPAGADAVVIRERLLPQADGAVLVIPDDRGRAAGPLAGANVRAAGEDFTAGELLVPAGRRLRPGDLAAAAAGGHAAVTVSRRPVVAIIPTGDEIRGVGAPLRHGEITDTNSVMLAARCRQLEAEPRVAAIVPDDPDTLAAQLRRAAAQADLILLIAGSSRGRDDHAAAVIAQVGAVAVAGVAVRPGHPALLGHVKRPDRPPDQRGGVAPVIGLPGYPLAAAVVFELFAAPLLGELTGREPSRERARARLGQDWCGRADSEEWVLVTLGPAGGGGLPAATPARRGAGAVSQLARADAWWPVPAGRDTFAAGEEIEVSLIR